ncbi:hypothetical protein BAUCODRAFT_240547 [Baudoinia panamericana UAMH 10762]|uniref:SnoaL-like domain-containing protein n=1 Tax=Baudoinia panamericana (strain UAMH 10762) TaxID=717646 RepID=M2N388_BAUPA|nr:uncharacterized protein BAUCODRAFT_240547 [Baudoinia panamericana UAMH 10762]EMC93444.1 hypothetical protein BAUCODRAFT_240547 [Baudoinia panamericana UAMH 10762]
MTDVKLYDKFADTATSFVLATSPKEAGTNKPDPERFLSLCAPNFSQSWGHRFFIAHKPGLQGSVDAQAFLDHQAKMSAKLRTWKIDITDVIVDVRKHCAMVRGSFNMFAKGHDEPVVNDIVYKVTMDETGDKVTAAIEFIDAAATNELASQLGIGG